MSISCQKHPDQLCPCDICYPSTPSPEIEKIGMFKGIFISKMTHEELLDFAEWASSELSRLYKLERKHSGGG